MRARTDGYTLLLVPDSVVTNTTLYDRLNFNFIRDIAAVRAPLVMLVNPSVPAKTSINPPFGKFDAMSALVKSRHLEPALVSAFIPKVTKQRTSIDVA